MLEVVDKVQEVASFKFDLKRDESRKGEYAKMIADIKKAEKILGWEPKRTIEDSVKSLVKWYKLHPNGWDK